MAGITDLICKTADGKLSFGNFDLDSKQKRSDFPFEGDLYKVKTFKEITKLERNGMFVYESVPGTVVTDMSATDIGKMKTNLGGKLVLSIEMDPDQSYDVKVVKM